MSPWPEPLPEKWFAVDGAIEVKLAPLPMIAAPIASAEGVTRRQTKDALRAANAAEARVLARRTGLAHAQVNAELNRQMGLRRITEATVGQLKERSIKPNAGSAEPSQFELTPGFRPDFSAQIDHGRTAYFPNPLGLGGSGETGDHEHPSTGTVGERSQHKRQRQGDHAPDGASTGHCRSVVAATMHLH